MMANFHKTLASPKPNLYPNDLFTITKIKWQNKQKCYQARYIEVDQKKLRPIGDGAYSTVFKLHMKGASFALKIGNNDNNSQQALLSESRMFKQVGNHPNIIPFYGLFMHTPRQVGLWLGLAGVDVHTLFLDVENPTYTTLTTPVFHSVIKQTCAAVAHCHKQGIIHADIKHENILTKMTGPTQYTFLLTDFNGSVSITQQPKPRHVQTRYFRAPEVILGLDYDHAIDTWSLGCLYIELAHINTTVFNYPITYLSARSCSMFQKKTIAVSQQPKGHGDRDITFNIQYDSTRLHRALSMTANGAPLTEIGNGTFSTIFKLSRFALKVPNNNNTHHKLAQREKEILKRLGNHPALIYVCINKPDKSPLTLALCESSVYDLFLNKKSPIQTPISPRHFKHFIQQSLDAVAFCHSKQVIHRDLKPENFLVPTLPKSQSNLRIVLSDFNGSKIVPTGQDDITGDIQTLCYRSPEIVVRTLKESSVYTNAIDIWSLGCLFVDFSKNLFSANSNSQLATQIIQRLQLPHDASLAKNDYTPTLLNLVYPAATTDATGEQAPASQLDTSSFKRQNLLSPAIIQTIESNMLAVNPDNRASADTLKTKFKHLFEANT